MTRTEDLSIREMAELSHLSVDTLRWYEREGVLPRVTRSAAGHRRYSPRERDLVLMLAALREGGVSTELMKQFVGLLLQGAVTHGRRIGVLEEAQAELDRQQQQINRAEAALKHKIAHYEGLIAKGLDCDGAPVPHELRARQHARS